MSNKLSLLILALLFTLAFPMESHAQTRSVVWENWDVDIFNIDMVENTFDVRENYNVQFSGTFRFGTAVIELTNLDEIRNIRVYEDGRALQISCSEAPGTYCVQRVSEGVSVVYYFYQPITNAKQRFTIEYTVAGALRVYEGGDQLWWTAIPDEHFGFPIMRSTVTVTLPEGYAPRPDIDPVETYGAPTDITIQGNTVTATNTQRIGGNESLEIRVQFPHNPDALKPAWQDAFDRRQEFEENVKPLIDLGLIALSLVLAIGGPLGVYGLWHTRGRDPKIGPVPKYLTEPPTSLPPAVVGTLVDEKADLRDILSTLIDLGRRGYLVIEEEKKTGLFGLSSSAEITFKRTDKNLDGLRKFERNVMRRVFHNRMERKLDALKNTFYKYIPQLQKDLYEELVKEGFFDTSPDTTRSIYTGVGTVVFFLSIVIGFLAMGALEEMTFFTEAIMCVPFALGLTGGALLLSGSHMPAKTRKGAEEAAKWNAFEEYLKNLERYSTVEEASQHFDDYLSYAVAFGIDRSWIRRFSNISTVPVPTWYYPTYTGGRYSRGYRAGTPISGNFAGGGLSSGGAIPGGVARAGGGGLDSMAGGMSSGLNSVSDGLTNMLNSASRTFSSRPQSSGSGGGGGFSGGGRSGGSSGGGSRGFG